MDEKILTLTDFEQRVLVRGMNEFRNDLIQDGKPTEDVDHVILKVIDAPTKKGRRWPGRETR
ncbi:hypothetical protein [Pseudoflavonifractor sp. An44]|uniref:hypothetical protein n=1 Tax=Pseudoflavonifractor sp. An44 TaxID=1965635 RepID=UPI001FA84E83|nr:hypothetical protein [Pseudoflavonifractor sp. An44]